MTRGLQGGNFKLFERIDLQGNGEVSKEEFMAYCRHEHAERGEEKGVKYVNTFLHTLAKKLEAYLQHLEANARAAGDAAEAERLIALEQSIEKAVIEGEQEDVEAGAASVEYAITLPVLLERAADIFQKLVRVKPDSGGLLTQDLLILVQG